MLKFEEHLFKKHSFQRRKLNRQMSKTIRISNLENVICCYQDRKLIIGYKKLNSCRSKGTCECEVVHSVTVKNMLCREPQEKLPGSFLGVYGGSNQVDCRKGKTKKGNVITNCKAKLSANIS